MVKLPILAPAAGDTIMTPRGPISRKRRDEIDAAADPAIRMTPFVGTAYAADKAARGQGTWTDAAESAAWDASGFALGPLGKIAGKALKFLRPAAAAAEEATGARAIIRNDNVFRGHGEMDVSIPAKPTKEYAVRLTGTDQLDDMIQSGLVRPKPGGYGAQKKATLYFGEADNLKPTILAPAASEGRIRIVAKSADIAGRKGPIPIDKLKHIFAFRDGKEVDILSDVLRQNREWKGK